MSSNRNSNISTKSNDSNNLKTFYKLKIILIGDSGVGKTSLLGRFMDEPFKPNKPCTINADFKIKSIKINSLTAVEMIVWDTCGQERYRSMTKQYFKDAHGIILMFDVCDKRSFGDLSVWLDEINKHTVKDDVSIVLCGNKIDLNYRNISFEDADSFAKNNGLSYCETSSKEGLNIEVAFETLTKEIIEKLNKKNVYENQDKKNVSMRTEKIIKAKERKREKDVKCC